MHDTDEKLTLIGQTRRTTMISSAALFSLCFTTQASFASGGGGHDLEIEYEYSDDETEDEPDDAVQQALYTQNSFRGLSQVRLNKLYYNHEKGMVNFRLRGFSDKMSPTILKMGYNLRRPTFNLLRDMNRIRTEAPRKDRLRLELNYSNKWLKDYKISYKSLKAQKSPKAEKVKLQLRHARGYKSGVNTWLRRPLEGRLKF